VDRLHILHLVPDLVRGAAEEQARRMHAAGQCSRVVQAQRAVGVVGGGAGAFVGAFVAAESLEEVPVPVVRGLDG
jgi:hypothetical protein